jgi:hypothetical protein
MKEVAAGAEVASAFPGSISQDLPGPHLLLLAI